MLTEYIPGVIIILTAITSCVAIFITFKWAENLFYNGDYISKWITPYIKGKGKLKQKIRRAV